MTLVLGAGINPLAVVGEVGLGGVNFGAHFGDRQGSAPHAGGDGGGLATVAATGVGGIALERYAGVLTEGVGAVDADAELVAEVGANGGLGFIIAGEVWRIAVISGLQAEGLNDEIFGAGGGASAVVVLVYAVERPAPVINWGGTIVVGVGAVEGTGVGDGHVVELEGDGFASVGGLVDGGVVNGVDGDAGHKAPCGLQAELDAAGLDAGGGGEDDDGPNANEQDGNHHNGQE